MTPCLRSCNSCRSKAFSFLNFSQSSVSFAIFSLSLVITPCDSMWASLKFLPSFSICSSFSVSFSSWSLFSWDWNSNVLLRSSFSAFRVAIVSRILSTSSAIFTSFSFNSSVTFRWSASLLVISESNLWFSSVRFASSLRRMPTEVLYSSTWASELAISSLIWSSWLSRSDIFEMLFSSCLANSSWVLLLSSNCFSRFEIFVLHSCSSASLLLFSSLITSNSYSSSAVLVCKSTSVSNCFSSALFNLWISLSSSVTFCL